MSVSGRPVFVLQGVQPSHRDIGPGSRGPDVGQLERALVRLGFSPGPVDDRYDGETAAAVAAWYESQGWAPFGATDIQLEQLRSANAAAASARDLHLQALLAIRSAAHGVTPSEIAQARIDVETARDSVDAAVLGSAPPDSGSETPGADLGARPGSRSRCAAPAATIGSPRRTSHSDGRL